MKKLLFFLGLVGIIFLFSIPQVLATDKDVGPSIELSAGYTAAAMIDCQAMNISMEYVNRIEIRDPGDSCSEAEGIFNMPAAPPSGFLSDILKNYQAHQFTRLNETGYIVYQRVVSTSNGGAGY